MKRIILLLIVVVAFSCKDEKKKQTNDVVKEVESSETKVLTKLILPNYPLWILKGLSLTENALDEANKEAFNIARNTTSTSSYVMIKDIPVVYNSKHRLNILVKQGDVGCCFGLRIMGKYPNRIDAVFDLEKGILKETKNTGKFLSGEATIEHLKDDWYKCTLISKLEVDEVQIIFGPTNDLTKTITWEANTNNLNNSYIIPTSLTLEEILN